MLCPFIDIVDNTLEVPFPSKPALHQVLRRNYLSKIPHNEEQGLRSCNQLQYSRYKVNRVTPVQAVHIMVMARASKMAVVH